MPLSEPREWVSSVAVSLSDTAIAPVNDVLRAVALCQQAPGLNGFALGLEVT